MKFFTNTILVTSILLLITNLANTQTINQFGPDGFVQIEEGSGGFFANLDPGDRFSRDHDVAGDINNDGVLDIVVGARSDDDGETDAGAVYILFMNNDGTVQSNQKISMLEGGFTEVLTSSNFFGYGVAGIGDYDLDGVPDIAVSAHGAGATNRALYIIHLNTDGTVKNYVKNTNIIAQGLSAIGDLNNDGRIDLVACEPNSDLGGTNRGAIRILFLNNLSEVVSSSTVTISSATGGFGTGLEDEDSFGGREVAMLGDLDGDGTKEMAVGAFKSDGEKGAVWIISLDPSNYNVVSKIKITEGLNGFDDTLDLDANPNGTVGAQFGHAMCAPGDLNGDGIPDLITGANQQGTGDGYILFLNADKTVKTYTKIDEFEGGYDLVFDPSGDERFSRSISFLGDLRGDGTIAVNVGGGAGGTGILYVLFFKPCILTPEPGFNRWSDGITLFTNWNHATQTVDDPLTAEQCALKAFETDAAYLTFNDANGRCICKDNTAILVSSIEQSTAYYNECFSGFTSVVPVQLISFTGTQDKCKVNLNWKTGSEDKFSHFVLEWSETARFFNQISSFETNTTEQKTYQFNHPTLSTKNYYRLKMLDLDGSFEYSNTIYVQTDCEDKDFIIYPNPISQAAGVINLHFKTERLNTKIEIINQLGSLVKEINVVNDSTAHSTLEIPLAQLKPGSYYLRIEGFNQTKKFVVL